jgi:hypothetical protein
MFADLRPKSDLTVLDYRNLTESVMRFDPGPSSTHCNPSGPEPEEREPEDPALDFKGMADIIKNEDSYKDDEALHALPDDLMMLQWAFKTSENVEILE